MDTRTRQGLGALLFAVALWVVSTMLGGDLLTELVASAAVLIGLGGLLLAAYGLVRPQTKSSSGVKSN